MKYNPNFTKPCKASILLFASLSAGRTLQGALELMYELQKTWRNCRNGRSYFQPAGAQGEFTGIKIIAPIIR